METSGHESGGVGPYVVVYVCLLAITGVEIALAYYMEGVQELFALLLLAFAQAGLCVAFFMQMREERRSLFMALIPAMVFVFLMMNMIWSDSFRLIHMRPFAK